MECEKVKEQFPEIQFEICCITCHEEDDTGYGNDLWFMIGDEERHVCCAVEWSFNKHREKLDKQ